MRRGLALGLAAALVVSVSAGTTAQDPQRRGAERAEPMLAGFSITVERTREGLMLKCADGCAWKSLGFQVTGGRPKAINTFGIADDRTNNRESQGSFLLRVDKTADGVAMSCDRGCAWKTLTFTVGDKPVRFNEYGMAGASSK